MAPDIWAHLFSSLFCSPLHVYALYVCILSCVEDSVKAKEKGKVAVYSPDIMGTHHCTDHSPTLTTFSR